MISSDTPENVQLERIKLYLKALDVGIWDYNIEKDILSCDQRWYDLIGRKYGSINKIADFTPFIHPDDVGVSTCIDYEQLGELIETDQRYHVEFRIIRPDGEHRWWRSVACILIDPGTGDRKAIGCVSDNTEFRLLDPNLSRDNRVDDANEDPASSPDADSPPSSADDPELAGALSARELECLSWVSVGKTAWETSIIMGRSPRTVEFHLVNATRKLSASNKIHAAVIAVRKGLI